MINNCISSYNQCFPLIFERVTEFVDAPDIGRSACVSKLWNDAWNVACDKPEIWTRFSSKEGIPLAEGQGRDRKADFQALYPITVSGNKIRRFLGEPIGQIPCISEVFFRLLNVRDPFDEEGKLVKDTFVFVVVPSHIRRVAGDNMPLRLNGQGNLVEVPKGQAVEKKELTIPLSAKNLRVLCSYPLEKMAAGPIFAQNCIDESDKIFNECGASPDKVRVWFMRKYIVDASRNLTYAKQEALVKGLCVTPFLLRSFYDAMRILEFGTCPDSRESQYTYARCPSTVSYFGKDYHVEIGGFTPLFGVMPRVFGIGFDAFRKDFGVAPCLPAETLEPFELGSSLEVDKVFDFCLIERLEAVNLPNPAQEPKISDVVYFPQKKKKRRDPRFCSIS